MVTMLLGDTGQITSCSPRGWRGHCWTPRWVPTSGKTGTESFAPYLSWVLWISVCPANSLTHLTSRPTHSRVTSTKGCHSPLWKMSFLCTRRATPLMTQGHAHWAGVEGKTKLFKNSHPAVTDKGRTWWEQKDAQSHGGYSLNGYSLRSSGMR